MTGKTIIAIDAGDKISGVAIVSSGKIIIGYNEPNENVIPKIQSFLCSERPKCPFLIIEDIRPYSLQLNPQVIETCKFIGELKYRAKVELNIEYDLKSRNEVKQWVYDNHTDLCNPRIEEKIMKMHIRKERDGKKGLRNANGEMRKPSFAFVDDRIIVAAMKEQWGIPTPKPGKTSMYGLSTHSWQALALATTLLRGSTNPY
jgi:hypothetical protein